MKQPKIDHYQFGKITIDGQVYRKDLIIHDRRILPDWWRVEGHSLAIADLETILAKPPRTLIIGQGAFGRMVVLKETLNRLEDLGIKVVRQPTGEAWRTYNQLRGEEAVAAAFHLTC